MYTLVTTVVRKCKEMIQEV